MLGDDKSIRSSMAVKDVLGYVNVDDMSRAVQDRCGAGHLQVDASSKSLDSMSIRPMILIRTYLQLVYLLLLRTRDRES